MEQLELEKVIEVCMTYGVQRIALFGSFVRGDARPDSDVDLIVTFVRPTGLLSFVRLERELSEVLGRKVDLLTEQAISPHLRARILSSQKVIFDAAG